MKTIKERCAEAAKKLEDLPYQDCRIQLNAMSMFQLKMEDAIDRRALKIEKKDIEYFMGIKIEVCLNIPDNEVRLVHIL